MTKIQTSPLERAKEIVSQQRESVIELGQVLYEIEDKQLFKQICETFSEYVREELDISEGYASKAKRVYTHFCIENDFPLIQLQGIDYERLYLASKTGGSVDEQFARAKTLSRSELRKEREEIGDHQHEPLTICKICSIRLA